MTPSRVLAAVALATTLAACQGGTDPGGDPEPSTTTPVASPTVSRSPLPTAPPTAAALPTDLGDGRHYARLTAFDRAKRTLTVDVVQFLTGEEAERAAREDGEEAFDYYVRNQNPRLRTLTVAANFPVVTNTLTASESGSSSKDVVITHAKLAAFLAKGEAQQRVFWFDLKGGVVVRLQEQYLP